MGAWSVWKEAGLGEGRGNGLELVPTVGRLQLRADQRAVQREL